MTTEEDPSGGSRYLQRAVFFPMGLAGRLYWLAVLPFHGIIFAGMANRITQQAAVGGRGPAAARRTAESAKSEESRTRSSKV